MDLNVNRLAKFSSENSPQTDDYDDEMKIQERLSGIRRASLRGYDIINNNFFVIENIIDLSDEHVIRNETINFNGKNPAGIIWANVMKKIHKNLDNKDFEVPYNIETAKICPTSRKSC